MQRSSQTLASVLRQAFEGLFSLIALIGGKDGAPAHPESVGPRIPPAERFSTRVYPAKRGDNSKWAQDVNEWAAVQAVPDKQKTLLADNGNPWAQIWMAVEYYSNRDLGNPYGSKYFDGMHQTEYWLRKAAEQGNITAQYMLWQFFQTLAFRRFSNLPEDRDTWIAVAANGGHLEAQEMLDRARQQPTS